jgi:Leucine-rich repeat (LRR) protein
MHMPQLEELFLQGNRIEELPFDWPAAFPNLRVLNVSSNRLKAVPSVAALPNLRRLLLNDNVICPSSLPALCGVRGRLEYISLERNPQLPGGVAKYADGAEAAQIMLAHIATFCKQPFGDVPLVQSKQLQD